MRVGTAVGSVPMPGMPQPGFPPTPGAGPHAPPTQFGMPGSMQAPPGMPGPPGMQGPPYSIPSGATTPTGALGYRPPDQGRRGVAPGSPVGGSSPNRARGAVPPLRGMPAAQYPSYPSGSVTPHATNVYPSPKPQPMLAQPRSAAGIGLNSSFDRSFASGQGYTEVPMPAVDVRPQPASNGAPFFEPNTLVEYFSSTFNKWIPAVVLAYSDVDGTYNLDVKQFAPVDRIRPRPAGEEIALENTLLPPAQSPPAPAPPAWTQPAPAMTMVAAPPPAPNPPPTISAEGLAQLDQELRDLRRDNHELRTQLTRADASARRYAQELEESRAREEVLRDRLRRPAPAGPPVHEGMNGGSNVWQLGGARTLDAPGPTSAGREPVKLGVEEPNTWSFTWGGEELA